MAFKTLTLDELHATALGALRAYFDDAQTQPGSDYDVSARMVASVGALTQMQALALANEIFVEDASDDGVQRHAESYRIERAPAAKALGRAMLTALSGTATQPNGSTMSHADGTTFTSNSPATVVMPPFTGKTCAADCSNLRLIVAPDVTNMSVDQILEVGGLQRAIKEIHTSINAVDLYEALPTAPAATTAITAVRGTVIDFEADEAGSVGNKLPGDTLTLDSPATGVNAALRVIECSGGGDEESIDELRGRVIDHKSGRPGGGNVEHIRALARETPGVRLADAVVFPSFRGLGSVDVYPIGLAGVRLVGSQVEALVLAHLQSNLPYVADLQVSELQLTASELDVDVTLHTDVGYERDFVNGGFTIDSGSTTTRTRLTTTPSGVIEIGDRVLLQVHSGGRWKTLQREVLAVSEAGGGPHYVDHEALPVAMEVGWPALLPGGPLAQDAVDALEAMFDDLGPSRKNPSPSYTCERHPPPSTAWPDIFRRAELTSRLMAIAGVVNVTITAPASDQQPNAPEVLRRGKITVRFTEG